MTLTQIKEPILYHYQNPTDVQFFVDHVGGPFTVIFTKKNGEQRKVTGIKTEQQGTYVTMLSTEGGYKKFNIGRVLYIGEM